MGEEMFDDYDAGIINDYGGGDVSWWQDYVRSEIAAANGFWRMQVKIFLERKEVENG